MVNLAKQISAILDDARQLNNTAAGNPRWVVSLGGSAYSTEPDTACANFVDRAYIGKRVTIHLNRAGRINYFICDSPVTRDKDWLDSLPVGVVIQAKGLGDNPFADVYIKEYDGLWYTVKIMKGFGSTYLTGLYDEFFRMVREDV